VLAAPGHAARIAFSEGTDWSESNPWLRAREYVVPESEELVPDVIFLSGIDWRRLDPAKRAESEVPIINLVQGVKHACENDPLLRNRFLPHKAIRICVSPEVTRALERTERVRGPMFTIRNAIDVEAVIAHAGGAERDIELLMVANKEPERGAAIRERLEERGLSPRFVDTRIPRSELLDLMGRAAVTVLVPREKEGFYLPALEAMALGTVVVCPDSIGNRSFCIDGATCFRPPYEDDAIVAAVEQALAHRAELGPMRERALDVARGHDLASERSAFLEILERVDELWTGA
jgi:glycosyltransferase involved in cell wall biosynthesis